MAMRWQSDNDDDVRIGRQSMRTEKLRTNDNHIILYKFRFFRSLLSVSFSLPFAFSFVFKLSLRSVLVDAHRTCILDTMHSMVAIHWLVPADECRFVQLACVDVCLCIRVCGIQIYQIQ